MIRDEFLKQQKEKNLSAKEIDKIRRMGERAFYTNEVARLSNLKRSVNLSAGIIGAGVLIITAVIIALIIIAKTFVSGLVAPVIILGVFWLIILSWYLVFLPITKKKLSKCKRELERVRNEDLEKHKKMYASMNK